MDMQGFTEAVAVFSMPGIAVVAVGPVMLGVAMAGAWLAGLMWPGSVPGAEGVEGGSVTGGRGERKAS